MSDDELISMVVDSIGNGLGGCSGATLSNSLLTDNSFYIGFIPDADLSVRFLYASASFRTAHEDDIEEVLFGLLEKGFVDAEFDGVPIDYERAIVLRSEGLSSQITYALTDEGRKNLGDSFGGRL